MHGKVDTTASFVFFVCSGEPCFQGRPIRFRILMPSPFIHTERPVTGPCCKQVLHWPDNLVFLDHRRANALLRDESLKALDGKKMLPTVQYSVYICRRLPRVTKKYFSINFFCPILQPFFPPSDRPPPICRPIAQIRISRSKEKGGEGRGGNPFNVTHRRCMRQ